MFFTIHSLTLSTHKMVHHNLSNTELLKKQAQYDRMVKAKLGNPFRWTNSFEINSRNIPSLMDLNINFPYKLYVYAIPQKETNFQKLQQLSTSDPRNIIYYQTSSPAPPKFNAHIPLQPKTDTGCISNFNVYDASIDQDILELHAPEFDPDL